MSSGRAGAMFDIADIVVDIEVWDGQLHRHASLPLARLSDTRKLADSDFTTALQQMR
jgi:hypothetical protein